MSTNFYILDKHAPSKEGAHVGKRYAAGFYCWDCKRPASPVPDPKNEEWICFYCGNTKIRNKDSFNPAMRELGFDKSTPKVRTGIDGAMCFIWALGNNGLGVKTIKAAKELILSTEKIVNEYGDELTKEDFQNVLSECINDEFSFERFS